MCGKYHLLLLGGRSKAGGPTQHCLHYPEEGHSAILFRSGSQGNTSVTENQQGRKLGPGKGTDNSNGKDKEKENCSFDLIVQRKEVTQGSLWHRKKHIWGSESPPCRFLSSQPQWPQGKLEALMILVLSTWVGPPQNCQVQILFVF